MRAWSCRYNGEIDARLLPKPGTVSNDGLTYTFHLRDVAWSDGTPITAQDFVDSWNLLIERATPMAQHTEYFTVDGKGQRPGH